MKRKTLNRANARSAKPSADSILGDIREITRAINSIKKIVNLPGMKSVLTSLYGERRYAEQLLAKNYPRIAKREIRSQMARKNKQALPPTPTERTTKGEKIARGWRYADAIKKNYSNIPAVAKMSKAQIRGEYKKFKRGLKTRIPDIAFYNPSP